MKPELSNGQSHFWQWDTKQKIKVDGEAKELHYIGIDGAVEVDGDGWAAVPDELLQNSGTLLGWAYLTDHTVERFTVGVSPRSKPPDYVYTPHRGQNVDGAGEKNPGAGRKRGIR